MATRKPRQLIVCCDGTNNNLTGGKKDTNVVKLCALLAQDPDSNRIVFYDPGVGNPGEMPGATWLDNTKRKIERVAGLAFGSGVYENIAESYRFLMRNYRPGDQIFIFGFSRGAFTARCVSGLVNLFGVMRADMDSMVSTLLHIYFAEYDDTPNRTDQLKKAKAALRTATLEPERAIAREAYAREVRRSREGQAEQARELFADADCRVVEVQYVGVWDTVESVGMWPFNTRFRTKPTVKGKRFLNVRHALSLDEHRAQFKPRLYMDNNGNYVGADGQNVTLAQLWFRGAHCDVGGGYSAGQTRLSDVSFAWIVNEAVQCGLSLHANGVLLDSEARVTAALANLPDYPASQDTIAHSELHDSAWWAVTGMTVRDRSCVKLDNAPSEEMSCKQLRPVAHSSVHALNAQFPENSIWGHAPRSIVYPIAAGVIALVAFLLLGQLLSNHAYGQSVCDDIVALFRDWRNTLRLNGEFAWQQLTAAYRCCAGKPFTQFDAPRWAVIWDFAFIGAYAYVLAWIAVGLHERRVKFQQIDSPKPVWLNHLGWALPIMVLSDVGENIATWITLTFLQFDKPILATISAVAMSVFAAAKWLGLGGFVAFCLAALKR
jgi:uncharacterized protein (DUF2235 family)